MSEVQQQINYYSYIKSPEWYKRRYGALMRAGRKCQVCGSQQSLQIHHNSYQHLGNEPASDLICLCEQCHRLFHEHRRLVTAPVEVMP
jgi:phage terminase large subunit GpA-like protein